MTIRTGLVRRQQCNMNARVLLARARFFLRDVCTSPSIDTFVDTFLSVY
jgi:hypothetical protein